MKQDDKYFYWNKGEVAKLSDNFKTDEFDCHCNYSSCKEQKISKDLITRLQRLRINVKKSITITSAFRCKKYQAYLVKSKVNTVVAKQSTHELGEAADCMCQMPIKAFEKQAAKEFESIGIAASFLHLDTRIGKRRWNY